MAPGGVRTYGGVGRVACAREFLEVAVHSLAPDLPASACASETWVCNGQRCMIGGTTLRHKLKSL